MNKKFSHFDYLENLQLIGGNGIQTFSNTNFRVIFEKDAFCTFYVPHGDKQIFVTISKTGEVNFSQLAVQLSPKWKYADWLRYRKDSIRLYESLAGVSLTRFVKFGYRKRDFFVSFQLAIFFVEKLDSGFAWKLFELYSLFLKLDLRG